MADGKRGMDQSAQEAAPTPAQRVARAALTIALVLLGLFTLREFLPALIWAGIIAIALWPLYRRACMRFPPGRHNVLMPSLFTLGVALVFLLPLVLVVVPLGHDASGVFTWIELAQKTGIPPPDFLPNLPLVGARAQAWWTSNLSDPGAASALLHRVEQADLFARSREIGSQILHRIVLFGFTLLTLFFLFRDGDRLIVQMHRASRRLIGPSGERIGAQMIASVHGTVDGLVLVGLGEGVLLGIAYAAAGVPHPTLLGIADRRCRDDPVRRAAAVRPRGAAAAGAGVHTGRYRGVRLWHGGELRCRPLHPSHADRQHDALAVHLGIARHPGRRRGLGIAGPVRGSRADGGADPVMA